jgi:REP element-mobilizing transposase RayT
MPNEPLAYFITFTCYGTWLHGDARGSVDAQHNALDTPFLAPDQALLKDRRQALKDTPYYLNSPRRRIVVDAIREIARRKGWDLLAVHARTNHVHIVVRAPGVVERVMNDFKTAASRRLNKAFPEEADRPRWTRHGSTIYLWSEEAVAEKVDYALNRQGEPMERYPETTSEPRMKVAKTA